LAGAAPYVSESSFDYMVGGIQASFDVSNSGRLILTLAPRIASLLVIFVAGVLMDAMPWRLTLASLSVVFVLGAIAVGAANGFPVVLAGQSLVGISGIVLGIASVALISSTFEGPARAWAFGLWGATASAVYLVFPIVASWIAALWNWRVVTLLWVLMGVVLLASSLRMPDGRMLSAWSGAGLVAPVLAGVVLAGAVTALGALDDGPLLWVPCAAAACVALMALVWIHLRASGRIPPLDLGVLRGRSGMLLIFVILLAQTAGTLWYFTRVVFDRVYQVEDTSLAIVIIPVQAAGILGGWGGGWMIRRIGAPLAAASALPLAGVASAFPLFVGRSTPLWVVVTSIAIWSLTTNASMVAVTAAFMARAPHGRESAASSMRKALSSVGTTTGGIVASVLVFAALGTSVSSSLQDRGVPKVHAEEVGLVLQDGLRVSDVPDTNPLATEKFRDTLHSQGPVMLQGKDAAYDIAGVIALCGNMLAALLMFFVWRRGCRGSPEAA